VPLLSLSYLLDPEADVPVTNDRTDPARDASLLDFLALRLARLMAERADLGLHRGYAERTVEGPLLQGRPDVAAQLRAAPARKDVLHSAYEELTVDVACNQVPRAAAELVLVSALLDEGPRRALTRALRGYAAVSQVPLGPECFALAAGDRLASAYAPLLDLCRLLADGLSPGAESGHTPCPAFLLDMERVFERYVCRGVAAGASAVPQAGEWQIGSQPLFRVGEGIEMRPDLTVRRGGDPHTVIDAKWKRSARCRTDLYQVLAYCAALGFPRGALVYPGRRDRKCEHVFPASGVRVAVHTLRVVGSPGECRDSARALVQRLLPGAG
jgi:5-methylcytosine-specific restriction enzyme subunit McrC